MVDIDGDKLCFIAEWFDEQAEMNRQYYLIFFVNSQSTQLINVKTRKLFLKKTKIDHITEKSLYIGNMIHVFGRPMTITDFGDEHTCKKLGSKKEKTLAIIMPNLLHKMGEFLVMIAEKCFVVVNMRMCRVSKEASELFYKDYINETYYQNLCKALRCGTVLALELMGDNAVSRWNQFLGPLDPEEARNNPETATTLRARYGIDRIQNGIHGSISVSAAANELDLIFPKSGPKLPNTALFTNCTLCVIKPHAVSDGQVGQIIEAIQARGFEISMLSMFYLEKANIEEFLEIYRGIVHEYPAMVEEMRNGPCVVMEIRGDDVQKNFREFTGPMDPDIARNLRPSTLRAIFGKNKIQNAVHCTDLPEDSLLEVEYFFKLLDGS